MKYKTVFKGRTLCFGTDRDVVFVNFTEWEDGSDVSCEDVVECITQLHRNNPDIAFVDGTGKYIFDEKTNTIVEDGNGPIYGEGIVFDKDGRPVVKIENGVILSTNPRL